MNGFGLTRKHLLHVDFALLEQVRQPLAVLQFHHLLQAEQEEWKMCAVLQLMGQICNADQVSNDSAGCKLGQVGLHKWDFFFNLGTLVQKTHKGLMKKEREKNGLVTSYVDKTI